MSSPAFRTEAESARGSAAIGKGVTITGQIYSREDLFVDGEVDGTIEMAESRLTIGLNGKVKAAVRAREVVIIGAVQGNVEATERVDIRKDAKLLGDIRTARIVIEDGAVFKGSIDIVKQEPKPAPKPAPAPAAAAAAASSGPAQQTLASDAKR
jgi:cytoskeletal protein CcmA (bactofilin family)